jgi:hypothetical protein
MTTNQPSRVVIGTTVICLLGSVFGAAVVVAGSFMTWRSDPVLGLYGETGWRFSNIISGDGKISFVLGLICLASFIMGAALRYRAFFVFSFFCSLAILALDVYELTFIFIRHGIVSPGSGVYAVLGGAVVGLLCALGGYLMLSTGPGDSERHILDGRQETN